MRPARRSAIRSSTGLRWRRDGGELDDLCHAAGALGLLGVPAFMFQEGDDLLPSAFREIARLTRGAYCRFDRGAAHQLRELLRAVAAYAAGGLRALSDLRPPPGRRHPAFAANEIVMASLLFGVVVLALVLLALNAFTKVNPHRGGGGPESRWRLGALARGRGTWARADDSTWQSLSASPVSACSDGFPGASQALGRARRRARVRSRGCARRSSRWSSITTPAPCADAFLRAPNEGKALDALNPSSSTDGLAE